MKRRIVSLLLLITFVCSIVDLSIGEGFLPSLDKELGISVPFIGRIINQEPVQTKQSEEGLKTEEYTGVSFDDYAAIGKCFGKSGFSVAESAFSNNVIRLTLKKEGSEIQLEYDIVQYLLRILYPEYYTEDDNGYSVKPDDPCLFPEIEDLAGVILPRLSSVLKREPDITKQTEDGGIVEEYGDFSEDDYKAVSVYLQGQGCDVTGYVKEDKTLIISLAKKGSGFTLKYDPSERKAITEYNTESYIEPLVTNTPVPTATPAPTVDPDQYNSYAAIFVAILRGTLKSPDSMQIHSIRVMDYQGDSYIVIDFSAMNGFGGYNRDTYSFKFEYGRISLSGNSSDYDQYENHKNQFALITTLDVDAVLRLVK